MAVLRDTGVSSHTSVGRWQLPGHIGDLSPSECIGYSFVEAPGEWAVPYSFDAASQLVESIAVGNGKWQIEECHNMKKELMDSDRVGLDVFHLLHFSPSQGRLTTSAQRPAITCDILARSKRVQGATLRCALQTNITGRSTCIASSSCHSVCCLNDCESLMNEVEGTMRAPTASPGKLLSFVGSRSSSSGYAPRELSMDMQAMLCVSQRVPLPAHLPLQLLSRLTTS